MSWLLKVIRREEIKKKGCRLMRNMMMGDDDKGD